LELHAAVCIVNWQLVKFHIAYTKVVTLPAADTCFSRRYRVVATAARRSSTNESPCCQHLYNGGL